MEKIHYEGGTAARIQGVGIIKLAAESERMTLNQAINAKSWQGGLPTRHIKCWDELGVCGPVHMRCFISLCHVKTARYKESPNFSGWEQPSSF